MKLERKRHDERGGAAFSLIEMLAVISVIGIVVAIAILFVGRINEAAEFSRDTRNAQQLAFVCNAAQVADLDFVGATLDATVSAIVSGGTAGATSPLAGTFFGVPGLSADDQAAARAYLSLSNGVLVYEGP